MTSVTSRPSFPPVARLLARAAAERTVVVYLARVALVAAAYYGSAHLGFAFAFQTKQVSAVWAPTGLALAALLVWGPRMWPGVVIGAFAANITASEPLVTALGITAGNTMEAIAGVYLLGRVNGFRTSLERMRDVLALMVLAAGLSTLVSASVGVLSLRVGGVIPTEAIGSTWRTWWLGDVGGDLLVAPFLLVGAVFVSEQRSLRRGLESAAIAVALGVVAIGVFSSPLGPAYVLFPLLFVVALRFRQIGAATTSLVVAGVGVWATAHGHGPFAGGSPDTDLLRAQTFVGVVALTALLAAAIRTERQHAEDTLAIIEQRVQERTQELQAANRELEAFSYSVSHDLRAPLRAIDGFSKAVITGYGDQLDDRGRHMLERVRAASQRMAQLIDEMLMLSRLTRKPMRRESVDLSALAAEIAAELRAQDRERADVEFSVQPGLVVRGDRELLRTLLQNLFENAWKFTAPRAHGRIELTLDTSDGNRAYVVRDNGIGFDMQYSDKLFRPFERLHQQTEFPGTGVGLTTVQRVAHRHGGSAWAHGEVDAGAAFFFTLDEEQT